MGEGETVWFVGVRRRFVKANTGAVSGGRPEADIDMQTHQVVLDRLQ